EKARTPLDRLRSFAGLRRAGQGARRRGQSRRGARRLSRTGRERPGDAEREPAGGSHRRTAVALRNLRRWRRGRQARRSAKRDSPASQQAGRLGPAWRGSPAESRAARNAPIRAESRHLTGVCRWYYEPVSPEDYKIVIFSFWALLFRIYFIYKV